MQNKNSDYKTQVYSLIKSFDYLGCNNPDNSLIKKCIYDSVKKQKKLSFIIFTCSTINSSYMFNKVTPERYVSLSPEGNNLTSDIIKLKNLLQKISTIFPVKLYILIGNTDPFYIYSQGWSAFPKTKKDLLWRKFSLRWSLYKNNLSGWLKERLPKINYELISWYELEKSQFKKKNDFDAQFTNIYKNINNYFSDDILFEEEESLSNNFGPGKYFNDIEKPNPLILKDWVKRKFAEYSVQGLWIKKLFPNAILLQNEKPSMLRTQMYQPLIIRELKSRLPVIYPFGVDGNGFQ